MAHTTRTRFEIGLLLLVGVLSAHQLFVAPIVGLADNGDFDRVMHPLGLAHVGEAYEDRYFLWVQPQYRLVARTPVLVASSSLLPAGVASAIDRALTRDATFDLRLVAAVRLALYLGGLWLILRAARPLPGAAHAVVLACVLLAAPDVAYVAYFNSFYSEPDSLVFLVVLVGIALGWAREPSPRAGAVTAYFAVALLVAATKAQHYAIIVPLAALPLALVLGRTWRKAWVLVVSLAAGALLLTGYLFARVPDVLSSPARWNVLFYGILVDSPSPEADLGEFGLEPDLARFVGTYGIEVDGRPVGAPYMDVGRRVGFLDIVRFYARHPDRFRKVASACAARSFDRRWTAVGNYTRSSGRPAGAQAPSYTGWSDLQGQLLPRGLGFLAAYLAVFVGVAAWELRRGLDTPAGRTAALGLAIAGVALVAFAVVVTASGTVDTVRILFLFQAAMDVSIVFGLAWMAARCEPYLPWSLSRRLPGTASAPGEPGAEDATAG